MDVLVIYQWCTFGGVERVVLNRAETFKEYRRKVKLSVGFLHDYGNALPSFQEYIRLHQLEDRLSAFLLPEDSFPDPGAYDLVLNIDTPQVFGRMAETGKAYIECHTPYVENRQYLKKLPQSVRGILVPSEAFKTLLLSEFSQLPPIFVVPNPVPDAFFHIPRSTTGRIFPKTPIAYMARLNELKNIREAIRIFESVSGDERLMYAVVGRGEEEENLLGELEKSRIIGRTFVRDQVAFGDVPAFIGLVRDHRGLFLSPSKGESFGLSAAEFISAGVPVLLSDIGPHRELVNNDETYLYPLGDLPSAKEKLSGIMANWEKAGKAMTQYGQKFKGPSFPPGKRSSMPHDNLPSPSVFPSP